MPDPNSTDEVYVDRTFAEAGGLHLGDQLRWTVFPPDLLASAQAADQAEGLDAALAMLNAPGAGQLVEASIVGIGSGLDGVVVDEVMNPSRSGSAPRSTRSSASPVQDGVAPQSG